MQVQVLGVVLTVSAPGLGHYCPLPRRHWPLLHTAQVAAAPLSCKLRQLSSSSVHIYFSFKISNIYFTQCVAEWIYLLSTAFVVLDII